MCLTKGSNALNQARLAVKKDWVGSFACWTGLAIDYGLTSEVAFGLPPASGRRGIELAVNGRGDYGPHYYVIYLSWVNLLRLLEFRGSFWKVPI